LQPLQLLLPLLQIRHAARRGWQQYQRFHVEQRMQNPNQRNLERTQTLSVASLQKTGERLLGKLSNGHAKGVYLKAR